MRAILIGSLMTLAIPAVSAENEGLFGVVLR